jgi:hypothetical protein
MPPDESREPDDPTRIVRSPTEWVPPTPAYGAITFHQVWTNNGVLCLECRSCSKRTALTKTDLPHSRLGALRAARQLQVLRLRRGSAAPVRSDDGRGERCSSRATGCAGRSGGDDVTEHETR